MSSHERGVVIGLTLGTAIGAAIQMFAGFLAVVGSVALFGTLVFLEWAVKGGIPPRVG